MARTLSGQTVPDDLINFDESNYHFFRGITDITNDLSRAEKIRLVPDFDITRDNYRLSAERGSGGAYGQQPLDTGVIGPAVDALITDPFSAPIESLGNKANELFGNGGVLKLMFFGLLIFAAYVYIAGGWFKRR
jgi:hypothetical protein